ncbi:MAG: DNA polymerase III, partial [Clostridiaceae bacterium]|nr:DNA polymerase III [Clostridiaceae bacterium]
MSFVVFDLEWNSAAPGKAGVSENHPDLPFEIIEIGAVKLSAEAKLSETFTANVRPQVYKRLNKYIARVTQRSQESLSQGDPFPLAVAKFIEFCG